MGRLKLAQSLQQLAMPTATLPQKLRQRWQRRRQPAVSSPQRPQVEDSIHLRIAVQALVTVGILATDMAASTSNALWAVPMSIVGSMWSYRQRHHRNIPAKIGIAVGMLVVLFLFLSQLVTQLGDTRIALAGLLIQLQVLHTFDLPRRKDLGYSAVIGVILLGVAATVSETTAFGGFLVIFLAIALPTLMLDYRSRLGLASLKLQLRQVAPKRLIGVLVAVLGLGLLIFAFIPRLPGYQLRTFPVSNPIEFQGQFDGKQILNPGYGQGAKRKDGQNQGGGTFEEEGDGIQFSSDSYYGFNETINQNLRGELTPKTVMRVRSQAKGYWRVLAFDRYTGQGWTLSRNDDTRTLRRSRWSYRFWVPKLFRQHRSKEIVQTYSILADFPNLIPALHQAQQIYFPTEEIAVDPEGSLRAPIQLEEGLTYTVVSRVSVRDRTLLQKVPARYHSRTRQQYLQLPPGVAERVRPEAEALLAKANTPPTTPYEQALYLTQALKQHYSLQPDIPPLADDQDLVEAFLFKFKGGYADHFSTTLTVMLRSIGIPARLVTGFGPGEFNPFTGMYVVKNTDAYALTEVYIPRYGWFAFDPIPGHELIPPSIEENQTFSALSQFWNWVAGWLPSPIAGFLGGLFSTIADAFAWLLGLFTRGWQGIVLGLLILTGAAFCGWLSWLGWRLWRYQRWLAKLPPMARLYQQMLDWLKEQGVGKSPADTPSEYMQRMHQAQAGPATDIVTEISQAYLDWRYGHQPANVEYLRGQFRVLRKAKLKSPTSVS